MVESAQIVEMRPVIPVGIIKLVELKYARYSSMTVCPCLTYMRCIYSQLRAKPMVAMT